MQAPSVTKTDNRVTFTLFPDAPPTDFKLSTQSSLSDKFKGVEEVEDKHIVHHSFPKDTSSYQLCDNSFVYAALTAYSQHLPLVLRPDDVWLAITTNLARFIDSKAEQLRPLFVSHEGKLTITANAGNSLYTADYEYVADQLCDQMDRLTKQDIVPWMTCNFSTTTKKDIFISKLVLMGAMKHYFNMVCEMLCGITEVTLEGTEEDWKEVRRRVDKMRGWDPILGQWAEVLGFVLDEFVKSRKGSPNIDFWSRIISTEIRGSGSTSIQDGYWLLLYFLPSLDEIKRSHCYGTVGLSRIPSAIVEVPLTVNDNGIEYECCFLAGFHAFEMDSSKAIRPRVDWALFESVKRSNL